ncbi:MAG: winged helix-turn-helix domain-containing protein [Phycisphaeraceae bacterium]
MVDSKQPSRRKGKPEEQRMPLVLAALANPHRLRIVAALHRGGGTHVSQLARDVGLSRPLLYLHLRRLEEAGLVRGTLTLSDDGKALKQYVVTDWAFRITPEAIADVADALEPPE